MTATRSGKGPDDAEAGSWATETLPLSLRKELLERELKKLGFRKAAAQAGTLAHDHGSPLQGETGTTHPKAQGGGEHGG